MTWRGGWTVCPRRQRERGWDCEHGEFFALNCGANVCPFCIETNVYLWGLALEHAAPERYAVLTGLTGDWQRDREAVNRFFEIIDRKGLAFRAIYSIEHNPRHASGEVDYDRPFHLNVWWHGDYVPQAFLSEAAQRVGWKPYVWVEKWEPVKASGGRYGMKEASGRTYGMKEASGRDASSESSGEPSPYLDERQADYLRRNGGRLMHARKSFWRDGVAGGKLSSMRETLEAQRIASGRVSQGRQSWAVYRGSEVLASSPVVRSAATGTSTLAPGSPSTAEPRSPGLPSASGPSGHARALTLFSSPAATRTSMRSVRTLPSSVPLSRWTPALPLRSARRSVTVKPRASGSS